MEMFKRKVDRTLIVSVNGRLDAASSPDFDRKLGLIMDEGETSLVFDMKELEYISSAGLRSFLILAKKLKAKSGKIALASLQDIVHQVFDISGFNQIISVFDSVEEALSNVK